MQNLTYITSATVAAPADIAGSVYYIDWSTPEFFTGDVTCQGCIDWKSLYKMLKIEDNIKSIINYYFIEYYENLENVNINSYLKNLRRHKYLIKLINKVFINPY